MTTEQKIIRAKVGLLELARQLGNVRLPPRFEVVAQAEKRAWMNSACP